MPSVPKVPTGSTHCSMYRSGSTSACTGSDKAAGGNFSAIDIRAIAAKPWFVPDATSAADQLNAFELLNHRYLVVDKASLQAFLDGSLWPGGKEAA